MPRPPNPAYTAQRHAPRSELDDYPTPPWAVRALFDEIFWGQDIKLGRPSAVWEPACNRGYMAETLREYYDEVYCTDIKDYGYEKMDMEWDFLSPKDHPDNHSLQHYDIITNPPFTMCADFILKALQEDYRIVAMFTRLQFLESVGRYETIFKDHKPNIIGIFSERVPLKKEELDPKASSATAYCWLIWLGTQTHDCQPIWIPPCRKRLERDSDYESR